MKDDLKQSIFISIWLMLLTFPIMVIRVNTIEKVIQWRWKNLLAVGVGAFILSYVWRFLMLRKETKDTSEKVTWNQKLMTERRYYLPFAAAVLILTSALPFFVSDYRVNVLITAMIYVVLGRALTSSLAWLASWILGTWLSTLLEPIPTPC